MATIKDVAKAAGVGTGTVSRALSGKGYVDSEKKKQIIKIAEQLKYDPSALLKRKNNKKVKSGFIGVVLPNSSQPFFGSFLWHVEKALEMHDYRTVIINVGKSSRKISEAIDLVDHHMLDGLIINADVDKSDIERLRCIPAVSFECEMGEGIPLVASDHIKGGELAAKLLFRCGCKNVAILSIKATTPVYARHRITECQRLLKKKGVEVTLVEHEGASEVIHDMEEMINAYLNTHEEVDGIFTEDVEAYFCLVQAKKRGISVPRDLKIVGYDGNEITRLISPQVTTIAQNTKKLAETCVDVLNKRINGVDTEDRYLVPVKIRMGGTT
ncbi:MAG: substrate-binding domain-containing protein [Lachnospiraceae bacterium]|nr:substrate-binding domain-containing protein [Lachnospiraceae bacterium]